MKDKILTWLSSNSYSIGVGILIAVSVCLLAGCNTVAGIGTDITRSAQWTQEKMGGSDK